MNELLNKKILFIALTSYSMGIVKQMRSMGAEVDYLNDKPNDGVICKTFGRLKLKFYLKKINKYYEREIEKLKSKKYDFILIIRGEYTPEETLLLLKKTFPSSKIILYMWDSIINNKGIEKKWYLFDEVYTFDRKDYLTYNDKLKFLPLFYYNEYMPAVCATYDNYKYALSFIGTGHEDRVKIVKSVMQQLDQEGLNTFSFFYLPHILIFILNKIKNSNFKSVKLKDIHFKTMPFEKVYKIYEQSKCIMDIESSTQTGLTMRSIEILGLKRKLITTNKDIINYDFYNPNNICVVERDNFVIDKEFFDKPYEKLEDSIYENYSLNSWLLKILK